MTEIAENMPEGLLAFAVGAGLQVMRALMEADVTTLAGPKGRRDAARTAVRHGRERGSVTLGGRRVPVTRPWVRATDWAGELPIPSYGLFSSTEILGKMAMEKMLAGLSTGRYPVGLHGRLLELAPRIGEVARIDVRLAVAGEKRPGLARQAAIPVDHRAEGVEHQRTHSIQRHVANSSNSFSSVT
jgi:hypothetical protein